MREIDRNNVFLNNLNSYSFYWRGKDLEEKPDDFSKFARTGFDIGRRFRSKEQPFEPFISSPSYENAGGVIYFGNDIKKIDFEALTRILKLPINKKYSALTYTAEEPREFGYLTQLRTVSQFALRHYFDTLTKEEYEQFPRQELTIPELYWEFIENQKEFWGTWITKNKLTGLAGGDGYWSWEDLSFGLMAENSYYDISRIWSRAYLITR